jgi:regulator of sigma E protease
MWDIIVYGIMYTWPFLLVLTVLVFFHELGHYLAARRYGVDVEVFSIGFGPEIIGWTDKAGTRWKISLIPLGGYVRFAGDADAASRPDFESLNQLSVEAKGKTLNAKPPLQRLVVAAAGPFANFLLSIVVFIFLFSLVGRREALPIIGGVKPQSVAEQIGLQPGDKVVSIQEEGQELPQDIKSFRQFQTLINKNPNKTLELTIERHSEVLKLKAIPAALADHGGIGYLGIMPVFKSYNVWQAIPEGFKETWEISIQTLETFGSMFIGKQDASQLGGMFTIAKYSHDFAMQGWIYLLEFLAILSLNLGLINLFPIPMLDGGHIVFHLIEIFRGKPVGEKAQEWAFKGGFFILISLMIFSHWNDVMRFNFFGTLKQYLNF